MYKHTKFTQEVPYISKFQRNGHFEKLLATNSEIHKQQNQQQQQRKTDK